LLNENIASAEIRDIILREIERIKYKTRERTLVEVRPLLNEGSSSTVSAGPVESEEESEEEEDVSAPIVKKAVRKEGVKSLPGRLDVAALKTTALKLAKVIELDGLIELPLSEYFDKDRSYINKTVTPAMLCFKEDCGSLSATFVADHGPCVALSQIQKLCQIAHPSKWEEKIVKGAKKIIIDHIIKSEQWSMVRSLWV
jgi:hypothetical protein